MRRHTLLALGLGLVVLAAAPAAFSDEAPALLTPVDFDEATGTLSASAGTDGIAPPAFYFNVPATVHLTSVLHFLPPSPCDGLVRAWDLSVMHQQPGKDEARPFLALLVLLATHRCTMAAASTPNGDGTFTLLSIGPGN